MSVDPHVCLEATMRFLQAGRACLLAERRRRPDESEEERDARVIAARRGLLGEFITLARATGFPTAAALIEAEADDLVQLEVAELERRLAEISGPFLGPRR